MAAAVMGIVYFYNNTQWFHHQMSGIANDLLTMLDSDQRQILNNTKQLHQLQSAVEQLYDRQEKTLNIVHQIAEVVEEDRVDATQDVYWMQGDDDAVGEDVVGGGSETSEPSDETGVSETSGVSEVSELSEVSESSDVSDSTGVVSETSGVSESSGVSETSESLGVSDSTCVVSDTSGVSDSTCVVSETSESSGVSDSTGVVSETSGVSESTGVSETSEPSEVTDTTIEDDEMSGVDYENVYEDVESVPVQPEYKFTKAELNRLRKGALILIGKQHGLDFSDTCSLHHMRTSLLAIRNSNP